MTAAVSLLFFVSGACGLVYEVLWAKQLALVLGNTALAHALVLSAYLGGLSAGSAAFGGKADESKSPLRLYGWLELGAAALGGLSPFLIARLSDAYVALARLGAPPDAAFALKAALCAAVLLPCAALMGGTLPVLSRAVCGSRTEPGVARLYFANGAGASLGALLAGFWLVPAYGLAVPVYFAAAANAAVGAVAMALSRGKRMPPAPGLEPVRKAAGAGGTQRRALAVAVVAAGFAALAYEIAWIRLLSLVLGSTAYSFSLMLSAFIAGLALGSRLLERPRLPSLDAFEAFGLAQACLAACVLVTLPLYGRLPYLMYLVGGSLQRTPGNFLVYETIHYGVCFLLMLAPTVFMGMALPLAAGAVRGARVGSEVGRVYALNTLGNVAGALAGGLWLLPALGIEGLIRAAAVVNLLAAGAVWAVSPAAGRARAGAAVVVVAAAALAQGGLGRGWDKLVLSAGEFRARRAYEALTYRQYVDKFRGQRLLYYKDDPVSTVTVLQDGVETLLKVNGKTDASLFADRNTEVLSADLPLTLFPGAQDVLVVGLGSGKSAGAALTHPVRRVDLVEISRAVVEAGRFFAEHNHRALADPRLSLYIEDAKTFLKLGDSRYDLIVSEPSNPWIAGTASLFSADFYREAKRRLKPGGTMAQWFHMYEMDNETLRLILRTFCSEFPSVTLWEIPPSHGDLLLLGSPREPAVDFAAAERELAIPAVKEELATLAIGDLATLLSLQTASTSNARALAGAGRINEDWFPTLEYQAPKALFLKASADALYERDQRQTHRVPEPLLLTRWLRSRGRPLSSPELGGLVDFHARYRGVMAGLFADEWVRRFPDSPDALWALARLRMDLGDSEGALQAFERLAALRPRVARYLEAAADLCLERFLSQRSFLTEAVPERCVGYLLKLADASAGAKRVQAVLRAAEIYANTGSLEKAESYVARAAGQTRGPEAAGVWLAGARMAWDRGRRDLAVGCIDKALAADPRSEPALALRRRLRAR